MGAAQGKLDAAVFIVGLLGGVLLFAEAYAAIAPFVWSGDFGSLTIPAWLGLPAWLVVLLVVVMALGLFRLIGKFERRVSS